MNSEEIKPVAIAIIELRSSEGISRSVGQSVSQQKNLLNRKFLIKFHNNLMQQFRVDLKTFLGLAMPNQCSQTVRKQISAGFGVIILGQNPQTFMIPIYSTVVLYDVNIENVSCSTMYYQRRKQQKAAAAGLKIPSHQNKKHKQHECQKCHQALSGNSNYTCLLY